MLQHRRASCAVWSCPNETMLLEDWRFSFCIASDCQTLERSLLLADMIDLIFLTILIFHHISSSLKEIQSQESSDLNPNNAPCEKSGPTLHLAPKKGSAPFLSLALNTTPLSKVVFNQYLINAWMMNGGKFSKFCFSMCGISSDWTMTRLA